MHHGRCCYANPGRDDVDAQALSNWQDVVHNASGAKRKRASRPMSRHNADNTTGSSAEAKVRALAATTAAIERALRAKDCWRVSGFADPYEMSWERVRLESIGLESPTTFANMPKWFHNHTAENHESLSIPAGRGSLPEEPVVEEQAAENGSTSSSSSSDSSEADEKETSTAEELADARAAADAARHAMIQARFEDSPDGRTLHGWALHPLLQAGKWQAFQM
jgi:hypothetical protein